MRPVARGALVQGVGAAIACALVLSVAWAVRPICVNGGSMRPALQPGDLALVSTRTEADRGDIALVDAPGRGLLLHRVVRVRDDGALRLKGDANNIVDNAWISARRARGVVVAVVPVGSLVARWKPR